MALSDQVFAQLKVVDARNAGSRLRPIVASLLAGGRLAHLCKLRPLDESIRIVVSEAVLIDNEISRVSSAIVAGDGDYTPAEEER